MSEQGQNSRSKDFEGRNARRPARRGSGGGGVTVLAGQAQQENLDKIQNLQQQVDELQRENERHAKPIKVRLKDGVEFEYFEGVVTDVPLELISKVVTPDCPNRSEAYWVKARADEHSTFNINKRSMEQSNRNDKPIDLNVTDPDENGISELQLIAGENRFEIAKDLNWKHIRALIERVNNAKEFRKKREVENSQEGLSEWDRGVQQRAMIDNDYNGVIADYLKDHKTGDADIRTYMPLVQDHKGLFEQDLPGLQTVKRYRFRGLVKKIEDVGGPEALSSFISEVCKLKPGLDPHDSGDAMKILETAVKGQAGIEKLKGSGVETPKSPGAPKRKKLKGKEVWTSESLHTGDEPIRMLEQSDESVILHIPEGNGALASKIKAFLNAAQSDDVE
ncbi:ParB N-terminal domain-containing protein [Ferrimonas marina]|nr:hypothetical protein [Ferrimonas marina]